jgi:hypothetical protein
MIHVKSIAAQGDVLFRRIPALPGDVIEQPRVGRLVVAHSETGHHHAIDDLGVRLFERQQRDPLICYLSVDGDSADVVHHRAHDTHQTLRLVPGVWEVRRQREWTFEQPLGELVVD